MYLMTLTACTLDLVAEVFRRGREDAVLLVDPTQTNTTSNNKPKILELAERHDGGKFKFEPQ